MPTAGYSELLRERMRPCMDRLDFGGASLSGDWARRVFAMAAATGASTSGGSALPSSPPRWTALTRHVRSTLPLRSAPTPTRSTTKRERSKRPTTSPALGASGRAAEDRPSGLDLWSWSLDPGEVALAGIESNGTNLVTTGK